MLSLPPTNKHPQNTAPQASGATASTVLDNSAKQTIWSKRRAVRSSNLAPFRLGSPVLTDLAVPNASGANSKTLNAQRDNESHSRSNVSARYPLGFTPSPLAPSTIGTGSASGRSGRAKLDVPIAAASELPPEISHRANRTNIMLAAAFANMQHASLKQVVLQSNTLPMSSSRIRHKIGTLEKREKCWAEIGVAVYAVGPALYHSSVSVDNDEWHYWERFGVQRLQKFCINSGDSSEPSNSALLTNAARKNFVSVTHIPLVEHVLVGVANLSPSKVGKICEELGNTDFTATNYDLITHNCNDFVENVLKRLLFQDSLPGWINRPARIASSICRILPPFRGAVDWFLGRRMMELEDKLDTSQFNDHLRSPGPRIRLVEAGRRDLHSQQPPVETSCGWKDSRSTRTTTSSSSSNNSSADANSFQKPQTPSATRRSQISHSSIPWTSTGSIGKTDTFSTPAATAATIARVAGSGGSRVFSLRTPPQSAFSSLPAAAACRIEDRQQSWKLS